MVGSELHMGSLALALGGFSVDAETELSGGQPLAPLQLQGRLRQPASGTAALIQHAQAIGCRVLDSWRKPGYCPASDSEQLATLCFAFQSTLGVRGRLTAEDEQALFSLASRLWDASLQALAASDTVAARASTTGRALEEMGNELFALIDMDSDASEEAARYVAFFSRAAASWKAAGQLDRARWCIQRAMRYSQLLEAQVANEHLPRDRTQSLVVALFNLYLQGAKAASEQKQQALANNLLSRAVQLSRHAAVGPAASICCAVSVAELQLDQAAELLKRGGPMRALAVTLLSSSYQQLTSEELQAAATSCPEQLPGLAGVRRQVLVDLCKAHLACGEASLACKALDAIQAEATEASATDAAVQQLRVEACLQAGRVAEALRSLMQLVKEADVAAPAGRQAHEAFLAGLGLALPHVTEDNLHSYQAAASVYLWKAAAAGPDALLRLLKMLLAQEAGRQLCHRLALQALCSDDVSTGLQSDPGALRQVHSALWHRATQCFETGSWAEARDLFSAAFQFSKPEGRAQAARALAACHSRLSMHQRAVEYLDIAARQEQQPSCLTLLMRVQELGHTGQHKQALEAIRSLATACPDFHPSLIAPLCEAAAHSQHPAVRKEALRLAVQTLIPPDASGAQLAAGQEATLLLQYVHALHASVSQAVTAYSAAAAAAAATKPPDAAAGGNLHMLLAELVTAVKLVTQRMKLPGWQARTSSSALQASAVCSIGDLAYNQLLLAHRCDSAQEHVVALSTALWQLLCAVDQQPGVGSEAAGMACQARVLLLATQALLDLHTLQPDSHQKLGLAAKLQAKLTQYLGSLQPDREHNLHLHLLHNSLCLETAARQRDGAAMLQCLGQLQPHAGALRGAQRTAIMHSVSRSACQLSKVMQQAAAQLLIDSVGAEGSLEAALELPAILRQLCPAPEQHLKALGGCCAALTALPEESRAEEGGRLCQWVATNAWNTAALLQQSADPNSRRCAAKLAEHAVKVMELCSTSSTACVAQLQSMRSALACTAVAASEGGVQLGVRCTSPSTAGGRIRSPSGSGADEVSHTATVAINASHAACATSGSHGSQHSLPSGSRCCSGLMAKKRSEERRPSVTGKEPEFAGQAEVSGKAVAADCSPSSKKFRLTVRSSAGGSVSLQQNSGTAMPLAGGAIVLPEAACPDACVAQHTGASLAAAASAWAASAAPPDSVESASGKTLPAVQGALVQARSPGSSIQAALPAPDAEPALRVCSSPGSQLPTGLQHAAAAAPPPVLPPHTSPKKTPSLGSVRPANCAAVQGHPTALVPCSPDNSDSEATAGAACWLKAVFAAQERVLGPAGTGRRPACAASTEA